MTAKVDPLATDGAIRWRRWAAYMECQEADHDGVPLDRDPNTDYRCERCGTVYRYVRTVIEENRPSRALCQKDHWRGVACDTRGCSWEDGMTGPLEDRAIGQEGQ